MSKTYLTTRPPNNFSRTKRATFWSRSVRPETNGLDTKSLQRNKVESIPFGLIRKLGIGRKAEHHLKDESRRKKVVCSLLEHGDHKAREIGNIVKSCRCVVRVVGGEATPYIRFCNKRECPSCSRREQTKKRQALLRVIEGLSATGTKRYSFVTLTMDRKRLDDLSCRNTFGVFRKKLSQLLNRPEVRKNTSGIYYAIEATKNETWNVHAHLLVEHEVSRAQLKKLFLSLWNYSLDVASIIKVKKFHIGRKSVCELVKYVVKDYSLTGKDFADFVSVIHGRRLSGATGSVRRGLKAERDKRKIKDDVAIPAPPRKPEGIKLDDGMYSLERIYTMAIRRDTVGIYLFRLLEYRARWGYRYEAQGKDTDRVVVGGKT